MNEKEIQNYFEEKMSLLREIVHLTEGLLSHSETFEDPSEVLEQRQEIIDKIRTLDSSFDVKPMEVCSDTQRADINSIIQLILGLDTECIRLFEKQKLDLIQNMKQNRTEQKIAGYGNEKPAASGRLLDSKE